jgi:hypothetical protein
MKPEKIHTNTDISHEKVGKSAEDPDLQDFQPVEDNIVLYMG